MILTDGLHHTLHPMRVILMSCHQSCHIMSHYAIHHVIYHVISCHIVPHHVRSCLLDDGLEVDVRHHVPRDEDEGIGPHHPSLVDVTQGVSRAQAVVGGDDAHLGRRRDGEREREKGKKTAEVATRVANFRRFGAAATNYRRFV